MLFSSLADLAHDEPSGGKLANLLGLQDSFFLPKTLVLSSFNDSMFDLDEIDNAYTRIVHAECYICRSSAFVEDGAEHSYAGVFESIEGRYREGALVDDIRMVIDSMHCPAWMNAALPTLSDASRAIVMVQEFIFGEFSGVFFSRYKNEKLLEYIRGTNHFLTSGNVPSSKIWLSHDHRVVDHTDCIQGKYITEDFEIRICEEANRMPESQVTDLLASLRRLEERFPFPIDVEWTVKDGVFYVLQVRPITTQT